MKFRVKALTIIFLLVLVIGVTATIVSRTVSKDIIEQQIFNHLEATANSRALHIETFLKKEKEKVKQLSGSIVIEQFLIADKDDRDYVKKRNDVMLRLSRTAKFGEYTYNIFVLNKDGIIVASSDKEDIGKDRSNDPYFSGGKQDAFIKDAYISSHKKRRTIAFSAPILNKENANLLGVVVARVSAEELSKITTDRTGLGKTGEIYLVNGEGYMITPSRFVENTFLKLKVDTENLRNFLKEIERVGAEEHECEVVLCENYLGENVLGVHAHIHEMEWALLAEMGEKEAFAPVTRITYTMLMILVVFLTGGVILAVLISRTVTQPIVKLHRGTEEIIKGNLDLKVGTRAKDEIGQLSRSFDRMTFNLKKSKEDLEKYSKSLERKVEERTLELSDQLVKSEQQRIATQNLFMDLDKVNENLKLEIAERKKKEDALRKSEEKYKTLTENVSVGIYRTTPGSKGKFIEANPAIIKMFGYKNKEEFFKMFVANAYQNPKQREKFNKSMIRDGYVKNEEVRYKKKNGKIFICSDSSVAVKDEKGKVKYYDGVIEDITERKQAEEELTNKIQELEEFNRLAVDRELKMIELKEEINGLLDEQGLNPKYEIVK